MSVKKIYLFLLIIFVLGLSLLSYWFYFQKDDSDNNINKYDIMSIEESYFLFKSDFSLEEYQEILTKLEDQKQKLEKNQKNPIAWYYFGYYKNRLGDKEGARLAWEKAFEYNPERFATANNLGDIYSHYYNNYERAEFFYLKALELKANYSIYFKLADVYQYKMENKKNSIEPLMKKAMEEIPQSELDFLCYLYDFYEDINNQEKMREYREKIIIIKPDYEF